MNPGVRNWTELVPDHPIPFLPMERVWTDRLALDEMRPKAEVATGYTRFAEGDLLLPKITPTFEAGRAAIAEGLPDGVGAGTTELHVLRPNDRVHPRWLLHFVNNQTFLRRGHSDMYGVAGQKRISEDFVKSYVVELPPLDEQRRVAEYLDAECSRIDELVAEQARIQELLAERLSARRRSVILGADGMGQSSWEIGLLKRFVRIARGRFTHRPRNDSALYDGEYPFIQTGDIAGAGGGVVRTWSQSLNEVGLAASRLAPAGTLVMAIAANIGDVARLGFDACFPDSIVALSPGERLTDDFLMELIRAMRDDLIGRSTLNTQLNINMDRIGNAVVPVPPIDDQEAIVAELSKTADRVAVVTNEVEVQTRLLREHRDALVTAAVTEGLDSAQGAA